MRIAVMQWDIREGDVEANLERVRALVDEACRGQEKPDAIVLPELWSTGYVLERARELATPEGEREARFLAELSRQWQVWFTGGSVLAETDRGVTNRAQVIDRQGREVAHYDKVHLVPMLEEHLHLVPGRSYCHFDLEGIPSGCVICYDIRFCEFLRKYALGGAELLFVAAEWPIARLEHWKTLVRARAIENQMYVIAANHCGVKGRMAFGGSSMIVDPFGQIVVDLGHQEGFGTAVVDAEKVRRARRTVPVFKDRVPELY